MKSLSDYENTKNGIVLRRYKENPLSSSNMLIDIKNYEAQRISTTIMRGSYPESLKMAFCTLYV